MFKMMNRAKKSNQQGSPRSKDAKAARHGVGAGANVGSVKPSLTQTAPQPTACTPGEPAALTTSASGGGRTKKVKQTSSSKNVAAAGGGATRRARATGKETMESKVLGTARPESNSDNGVGGLASVSEQSVGPKMERSNSFFLTRKLSTLYNKLSGSRENVSNTNVVSPVAETQPFQFVRSRSMSAIQLKRAYRRSQNESTLQNLHEDAILERSESTEETIPSTISEVVSNAPEITPPPVPRFERSNSILASIRRKISFRSERRSSQVSNWSTSLQNLRQEDFMISYDDLSFIDYDQFNSYETNLLKRKPSCTMDSIARASFEGDPSYIATQPQNVPPAHHQEDSPIITEATNGSVVRRRWKNDTLLRTTLIRKSMDVESNLDRDKNVYRNSLDAEKLLCISNVNRKSFRWSADVERDVVALDLDTADFTAAKPLAELVAHRHTPPPVYDVCDSGMIDGSESVKLCAIANGPHNTGSSMGYISRSESFKRCRSYGGERGSAFEEGFGYPSKPKQFPWWSLSLYPRAVFNAEEWHIKAIRTNTLPPMMDENVQHSNESIKQRKPVRSVEQTSPVCDAYSAPPERNMHSTSHPHPILPQPLSSLPAPQPATVSSPNATSPHSMLLSPTQTIQDDNSQMTVKNETALANVSNPLPTNSTTAFSLILPQNLSRSFDQTAAQSPPKYQIYHQFSRISNTTQQFIQRQQQQQLQQDQQQHPMLHTQQLQRQQSPQTQPASPVTNYQAPLFRKASYGSSHYAHYSSADPPTVNAGTLSARPTTTYHQHQSCLQCSKPEDQRSNNPFILNFNNISGCCLKNSPTSSSSPSATSPTDRSTASLCKCSNTQPVTDGGPSTTITSFVTSGTKRTRSLMLKSTSPLQHTTRGSPSQALSSPQGPPVPPRLSQKQSGGSVTTSNISSSTSNHPSIDPTSMAPHCNASSSPATVTSTIVTGTCYVTPPTPAPLSASDKHQELPSMTFGNVTPAVMSITELNATPLAPTPCCNKTPTDGNLDELRNSERRAEIVPSSVRKKRDDFLKATMKICLVVSPPSKLQMKSLSLTHLDDIERQATTPTIITNDPHLRKSDNSDTSNTSIASASGSFGYGGNTVSGGSSVHAVSPKDVCVTVTSGSALIDISNSDGGCINPAYDNGDGGPRHETNDDISISDMEARICPKQESMDKGHECQGSGTCCMLTSPSCVKTTLSYSSKLSGTGSSSSSLKKKSSSFLHRERKKPVLTRSQVSSSEYFSVCFESDHNDPGVLIPATKGVRLAECLRASLSRRSLSFSQIYVTDNGFNNPNETGVRYTEPLDANMDISALAGRTLIVSERDVTSNRRTGGHLTLQKAASVGNQPSIMSSTNKLFTSTSTDDNYDQSPKASSASGKQSKQKWTIPFGSKGPQKSKLCELLDSYNKEIPKSTSSSSNFNNPEYVDALVGLRNLPQCWTEIVNCSGVSEAETKIQSAIWELVTTEVYYILALQTVTDLFLACLEDIQSQNILADVDQNKLFSNIRDIWEANLRFWTMYLHPMVKHSLRTKEPMSIYYFQRGFVDFATIFTPYTKYCAEQSTCQYYCKEMYHNNPLFMTYCAWCESQKMCNRLRLADILVRPMQRLTKYGLLLAAIKKHINDEAEGEAIDAMIHSVEEFVAGVNSHLTTRQESERLKGINARIDCYEVVDANNETLERMVKQHSTMFDLCQPMRGIDHGRKVFLEGDLKYKDNTGKMDVHCFLFTDFLLVCKKNKNDKLKIVRQPYMTDRLMVQLKDQAIYCCYLNELNMVVTAFTLQSPKAQHWYDSITKVKHIYNRMKQGTFGDVRQYGNIINISNSCNNSTSNSNMNINNDNLSIKKSPLNSSIGSRVSSLNNSHSGSVDLNESKQVSIDFEKTNSLSSDEGAGVGSTMAVMMHSKYGPGSSRKPKNTVCTMQTKSSNSLTVQPYSGLGQSMPNLNLNSIQNSNTLSVPGTSNSQSHSGMVLLSPSQRGISYPPPSPTRATLRRGFAFSTSIKNPPLIKTRNVSSQQSFTLSQQQSLNTASLGQHQQCLPPSANTSNSTTNNTGTNASNEGCSGTSGISLSSANVSFFKRKNSFQSVPNNSATTSMDQTLPNET